jgi:drug/metabolite transporter (DMT)-like permease
MEKQKRFGVFAALLAAVLFGASTPLSKPLLDFLNNFQLAGLLYLGAALGVTLILIRQKSFSWPWQMTQKDSLRLAGAVLFGGVLGPVFLLAGLRIAAAASVSLWLNMEMVATVLIGYFFFKDHLTTKGWLAALGILVASTLLAWEGGLAGFKAGGLIALACISWGIDNHLTALIDGITPAQSTFWKGIVAGTVNLTIGLFVGTFIGNAIHIGGALVLGIFAYGISILLYITSAQNLGATRSQLIFSSAPFFGLLISLITGESLSIYQGLAFVLFSISTFFLFKESHAHLHTHLLYEHVHVHYHPDLHHDHPHPEQAGTYRHSHLHEHQALEHSHPHWPDLHHRHEHDQPE